jgi:hypothetical protein
VDDGLSVDDAKTKYVELVESLKVQYGYSADKVPEPVGGAA